MVSAMSTAVVTGASRGIGLALCRALLERKMRVIAACRRKSPDLERLGREHSSLRIVEGVDVATVGGPETLAAAVGSDAVDLLVNNAGILCWGDTLEAPKYDEILQQFEVNAVGPLRVTSALRKNLGPGSKAAFITSRMGSIADNGSGGHYGYRMSKAALNIAAVSIARDLAEQGVAVVVLHPGMVKTEMIGMQGEFTPAEAAAGLLARIDELTLETTGKFFHQNGQELPW